jgi:transcriptional regulator with XRE-family HTH domain
MKIARPLSDAAVLAELGARLAQTRLNRNLSQDQLAVEAGISKRTLERLEAGHPAQIVNLVRVLRALDLVDRLDLLIPEPIPSPLAQLKLKGRKRERASRPRTKAGRTSWTWDDDT